MTKRGSGNANSRGYSTVTVCEGGMLRNKDRQRVGIGPFRAALLATAPLVLALPAAPVAWAQTQDYLFNIESQPLSSALLSLGRQADLSVLAPTALVEGKRGPEVKGQMSAASALDRLLQGSGLTYVFVQTNAVKIVARDQAQRSPLPTNAPASDEASDRVIVTGTSIRGVPPESSPVDIYTSDDIVRSGAATTEQFASKIPQNLGTTSQYAPGAAIAGSNLDAVTALDLRGLGIGTTLTLVNGHRMALSNSGRSADVSFIPLSAIERVEVLTDGASAIYGSDAVGGVVNFILRDDYEGAETRLTLGGVSRGGLRQGGAGQTFGTHWDGGRGLIAYDYHTVSALETSDRSYASAAGPGTLTPVETRHNLFTTASQDLTDRLTLNVDLGAGWRKVKNGHANLSSTIPANHTRQQYESTSNLVFGNVHLDYALTDTLDATFTAAYASIDTDGLVSSTRFNLTPPTRTSSEFDSQNSQLDLMGKIEGSLMALPAGDLKFSAGGGVLTEKYRGTNPSSNLTAPGELGRQSTYAFGELYVPIVSPDQAVPFVRKLSVNLAARYTDYQDASDPGLDRDFGDSIDPKIGVAWSPVEALNIRGTYGSSFRAPALTQLDPAGGSHYLLTTSVAGTPSIVIGMAGYAVPDLGPETADSYTLGFDWRPPNSSNFELGMTYYNIDYTNRIAVTPTGGLNPFAVPDQLPDVIYRPPSAAFIEDALRATRRLLNVSGVDVSNPTTGAATLFSRNDVWMYDVRFRNLAMSKQDGIDLSLRQSFDTAWGDLQLGTNVSHVLSYDQKASETSATLPAVDVPGQPADWRGRAYAGLTSGPFGGTVSVNYTDNYSNPIAPVGQQDIESWATIDLSLSYDFAAGKSSGPRLSLSVQNLFDEDPPFLARGAGSSIIYPVGFDPANANPLGRFAVLSLTQKW